MSEIILCRRHCGYYIIYLGKDHDKKGSTGWYEIDQTKVNEPIYCNMLQNLVNPTLTSIKAMHLQEHTYRRCDKLIRNHLEKQKVNNGQTTLF